MRIELGRKLSTPNDKWQEVFDNIEDYVSKDEIDVLAEKTVANIKQITSGKKAAYGWSGGKDSIVLSKLCEKAGIKDCVFIHSELEYPEYMTWCLSNMPEYCNEISTGQDLEWLKEHAQLLFADGQMSYAWDIGIQRRGWTKYFFANNLDILIVGHRKADGNVCGTDGIISKKSGETRYSPMYEWSHEAVLAYIHYNQLELPPIYKWKDGWKQGTHPWAARSRVGSIEQGYKEVYDIDSSIIVEAAEVLPSARLFLEKSGVME